MNITSAQYINHPLSGEANVGVLITIDGIEMTVPLDPANRHYAEIVKQIEAGTLVVQPADEN